MAFCKYSTNYSCFIQGKTFLELHSSRLYLILFHFLKLFSVYLKVVREVSDFYIAEWHEDCEVCLGKNAEQTIGYLFLAFILKFIWETKEP